MLTTEELEQRREEIVSAPQLSALLERLAQRAMRLLEGELPSPPPKALLTADGGVCPEDGTRLAFDPWSPSEHRCTRCGRRYTGERHARAWAHYQHLWLAERMAQLATVGVMAGREEAKRRADRLLRAYRAYPSYPNQDNVLGPSRLFFSTYLESVWITSYLAAAMLLRDAGELSDETAAVVSDIADEAATLIGEFDEGLSNRQTWHNAALAAIAVWFEDEDLAGRAIEGSSGIITHLLQGFGPDGMWFEGDNYHLFALRGQLLAIGWARQAGVDLLADEQLARRLLAALRAPTLTALPDFTFPARKDSRFGVSLAQPMYLELWEVGLARLGESARASELWNWLRRLYQSPAPEAQTFDSYLHEAGEPPPTRPRTRADLSWWALMEMVPELPGGPADWNPGSTLIEGQGLAVLRAGDRYAGLECGPSGGGHGHSDRLNLILHAGGVYWLPDLGAGSYVARDLFWYRSTLAHNAPRLDGRSQGGGDAVCENFEVRGDWVWAKGRYRELTRTLVAGPQYLIDLVELSSAQDHLLELPLHLSGAVELPARGSWVPAELEDPFARRVERFVPEGSAPLVLRARSSDRTLSVYPNFEGELLRGLAPGAPGSLEPATFYLLRSRGRNCRIATLLETGERGPAVRAFHVAGDQIDVTTEKGTEQHVASLEGWDVRLGNEIVRLRGRRRPPPVFEPLVRADRPLVAQGVALYSESPALDGTLDGFDLGSPLELNHEDQFRRAEEPYSGADEFSALGYVNWNHEGIYLGIEITKPQIFPWDPQAPPLRLDNEPDEIHSDGVQIYLRLPGEDTVYGFLVLPSRMDKEIVVRPAGGLSGEREQVRGGWSPTDRGYTLTIGIQVPGLDQLRPGDTIEFDLLVNQMLPDRQRRAGQLVWTGGGGWTWLRGDRQDPSRFGKLELQ